MSHEYHDITATAVCLNRLTVKILTLIRYVVSCASLYSKGGGTKPQYRTTYVYKSLLNVCKYVYFYPCNLWKVFCK